MHSTRRNVLLGIGALSLAAAAAPALATEAPHAFMGGWVRLDDGTRVLAYVSAERNSDSSYQTTLDRSKARRFRDREDVQAWRKQNRWRWISPDEMKAQRTALGLERHPDPFA